MDSTEAYSPPSVLVTEIVISFTATRLPREIVMTPLPGTALTAWTPSGRVLSKLMSSKVPSDIATWNVPASASPAPSGERSWISVISTGSSRMI